MSTPIKIEHFHSKKKFFPLKINPTDTTPNDDGATTGLSSYVFVQHYHRHWLSNVIFLSLPQRSNVRSSSWQKPQLQENISIFFKSSLKFWTCHPHQRQRWQTKSFQQPSTLQHPCSHKISSLRTNKNINTIRINRIQSINQKNPNSVHDQLAHSNSIRTTFNAALALPDLYSPVQYTFSCNEHHQSRCEKS